MIWLAVFFVFCMGGTVFNADIIFVIAIICYIAVSTTTGYWLLWLSKFLIMYKIPIDLLFKVITALFYLFVK